MTNTCSCMSTRPSLAASTGPSAVWTVVTGRWFSGAAPESIVPDHRMSGLPRDQAVDRDGRPGGRGEVLRSPGVDRDQARLDQVEAGHQGGDLVGGTERDGDGGDRVPLLERAAQEWV